MNTLVTDPAGTSLEFGVADAIAGDARPASVGSRFTRRTLVAGLVGLLVGVTAAAGTTALEGEPAPAPVAAAAPAALEHPAAWDERLTDLVAFVEKARGYAFRHPVHVEFLGDEAFGRKLAVDPDALSAHERQALDHTGGLLQALGLAGSNFDLVEQVADGDNPAILGFYDPAVERIFVRGKRLTPARRATLVHELTHALQDQYFDLSRLAGHLTTAATSALRALVEGDAMRVARHYVERLDRADIEAYIDETEAALDRLAGAATDDDDGGLPTFLAARSVVPYALGEQLALLLEFTGGNDAVDRAFEDIPSSEEHLVDPFAYLDGVEPVEVPAPRVPGDEQVIAEDDLGAIGWYLVLAERIDPRRALDAVDGWGGGTHVLSRSKRGRACMRASFTGDTPRDTDEMGVALDRWVATMPAGAASVEHADSVVTLTSCEPGGTEGPGAANRSLDVLLVPVLRSGLAVTILTEAGTSRPQARCTADETIDRLPDEALTDLSEALADVELPQRFQDAMWAAAAECGVRGF